MIHARPLGGCLQISTCGIFIEDASIRGLCTARRMLPNLCYVSVSTRWKPAEKHIHRYPQQSHCPSPAAQYLRACNEKATIYCVRCGPVPGHGGMGLADSRLGHRG